MFKIQALAILEFKVEIQLLQMHLLEFSTPLDMDRSDSQDVWIGALCEAIEFIPPWASPDLQKTS